MNSHPRLARFAFITLLYNIAVVVWGAYVRATGSGAGCGSHWPLCNGEVIPREPELATLIELSHRLTSGIALLLVVALAVWAYRACRRGHPARGAALASLLLMLLEAGIGAGLVLFELVADNESIARALFMATHLVNTFLLLGAITLTWRAAARGAGVDLAALRRRWRLLAAVVGMLLVGMSGAVAALGDTLFPATSLQQALAQDLSATAHLLIRLRIFHPLIAVVVGLFLLFLARSLVAALPSDQRRSPTLLYANLTTLLVLLQLALGTANVALLAPVWMQLLHLTMADALWVVLVLLVAERLSVPGR